MPERYRQLFARLTSRTDSKDLSPRLFARPGQGPPRPAVGPLRPPDNSCPNANMQSFDCNDRLAAYFRPGPCPDRPYAACVPLPAKNWRRGLRHSEGPTGGGWNIVFVWRDAAAQNAVTSCPAAAVPLPYRHSYPCTTGGCGAY